MSKLSNRRHAEARTAVLSARHRRNSLRRNARIENAARRSADKTTEEAQHVTAAQRLRRPTIAVYLDVITAIEQKLDQ